MRRYIYMCVCARVRACVRACVRVCVCVLEQALFVHVFTVIPPQLSDPCNFITVPLVTREAEQTTLLFWSVPSWTYTIYRSMVPSIGLLASVDIKQQKSITACCVCLTSHGFTQPTGRYWARGARLKPMFSSFTVWSLAVWWWWWWVDA